ncbi:hypothetical protein N9W78_00045 [bacterium]|nr:hypothetical protein [bacterium]
MQDVMLMRINFWLNWVFFIALIFVFLYLIYLMIEVGSGVSYIEERHISVMGCSSEKNRGTNYLEGRLVNSQSIVALQVRESAEKICSIDWSGVSNYKIGFFKQYLVYLKIEGEVVLSLEKGVASYRQFIFLLIIGGIAVAIISFCIVLVSNFFRNGMK